MYKFYEIDINSLPDPKSDTTILKNMPKDRVEKVLRYVREQDRKLSLGAGLIIENIKKEHNITSGIKYTKNNKPSIDGCCFNVAHSDELVIGVWADAPIGCDVEKIKQAPKDVAEKYFTKEENEYIKKSSDQNIAFYEIWTIKESYLKMTGEGLLVPLCSIQVVMGKNIEIYRNDKKENVFVKNFLHNGYAISVCCENSI